MAIVVGVLVLGGVAAAGLVWFPDLRAAWRRRQRRGRVGQSVE